MTVLEYALLKHAATLMSPAEREYADLLAQRADAGDQQAGQAIQKLAIRVVTAAMREGARRQA